MKRLFRRDAGRRTRMIPVLLVVLCCLNGSSAVRAQEIAVAQVNMVHVNEGQFIQWVFGNQLRSVQLARQNADDLLGLQVDLIADVGGLSDEQLARIRLAGQGDIERFFGEFAALKRSMTFGQIPQDEWQQMWAKISPLQSRFMMGLHGRRSLLQKTVLSTLEEEQFQRYQKMEEERNRRHYRASVLATISMIEGQIPLTSKQRERLLDVVLTKTSATRYRGPSYYRFHSVLFQMSTIPEEDLKPIFLENEWPVMRACLQHGRSMKQVFEQMNVSIDDE